MESGRAATLCRVFIADRDLETLSRMESSGEITLFTDRVIIADKE